MNKTNRQILRKQAQASFWDHFKRIVLETLLREVESLVAHRTSKKVTKVTSHKRTGRKVSSHARTTRTKPKPARRTGGRSTNQSITRRAGSWLTAAVTRKASSVVSAAVRRKIKQTVAAFILAGVAVLVLLAWFGWQDLTDTGSGASSAAVVEEVGP